MRPRRTLATALAALLALALAPVGSSAQDPSGSADAATPEAAVTAYVEAIAAGDVEAILDASAADEMAAGFDFAAYTERLGAMALLNSLAPAEYPMFGVIDRYQQSAQILGQVRNLVYGLLSDETIDGTIIAPVDAERIAAFVAAVDPTRLAGLTIIDVRAPQPDITSSERYRDSVARIAEAYGADEMVERLALIELDGETYGLGFSLLRYGDDWLVSSQSSPIAGTPIVGTADPMSRAEFEAQTGG